MEITGKTKRQGVGLVREQLEHNPMLFSSEEILTEMIDFRQELNARRDDVIFPGVKEGGGRHDDRVMALIQALYAHVHLPSVKPILHMFGRGDPSKVSMPQRWDVNSIGR